MKTVAIVIRFVLIIVSKPNHLFRPPLLSYLFVDPHFVKMQVPSSKPKIKLMTILVSILVNMALETKEKTLRPLNSYMAFRGRLSLYSFQVHQLMSHSLLLKNFPAVAAERYFGVSHLLMAD